MCAALTDDDLFDDRATHRTWLAVAAVHAEMILKITTAIDPVYAGAVVANALLKNDLDSLMQFFGLSGCH